MGSKRKWNIPENVKVFIIGVIFMIAMYGILFFAAILQGYE